MRKSAKFTFCNKMAANSLVLWPSHNNIEITNMFFCFVFISGFWNVFFKPKRFWLHALLLLLFYFWLRLLLGCHLFLFFLVEWVGVEGVYFHQVLSLCKSWCFFSVCGGSQATESKWRPYLFGFSWFRHLSFQKERYGKDTGYYKFFHYLMYYIADSPFCSDTQIYNSIFECPRNFPEVHQCWLKWGI